MFDALGEGLANSDGVTAQLNLTAGSQNTNPMACEGPRLSQYAR
jgi:hypothetical protein